MPMAMPEVMQIGPNTPGHSTPRSVPPAAAGRSRKGQGGQPCLAGFNLLRWFAILSFASIALVSVVSSLVLSRFITSEILQHDAAVTMEFIQSAAEVENVQAFLQGSSSLDPSGDKSRKDIFDPKDFFGHVGNLPDVLRANIYGRDRTLIWSTEKRLVGQRFLDRNEDLEEALAGTIALETGITGREEHPKQEHKFLDDKPVHFVETYIPLKDPATQQVMGVVELYRVPRAVFATIGAGRRLIWRFGILGGLFLFVSLFGIVYRADRTIRSQQERLVESETMSALGEMASAVAHGIRNPLASIRSSAELSSCEKGSMCGGCSRDIITQVDRLESWVRDLLTYSQPEHGTLDRVSISSVVRRSLEHFTHEAAQRGIAIVVALPPDLSPVQADEALLGQVLNSVVANAVEAMPRAGQLRIQAEARDRRVTLAITDTGVGIPAAQLAKVFTPFHTTKAHGLGVGLSLARRIIRRFGGDITIRSQVGHGTTVTLHLLTAR
jgi:two-component system, NtrC family, sensor histidine kinase HydH